MKYILEYRENILFIRIIGILNKNNINILDEELDNIVNKLGISNIVFNLEGVTNIDTIASNKLINWSNIINIGEGVSYFCGTNKLNNVNIINNELSAIKEINWKS
jgi:anti-anti-sigma regulatory factor